MFKVTFLNTLCNVNVLRYQNGRPALQLMDATHGYPFATASINVPEVDLQPDEILVKDYSENAGILTALEDAGLVTQTGREVCVGHAIIPVCKMTQALLQAVESVAA